ncbi:hypothetical protein EDC01DRAFT_791295 [Geopyxis carbonaria]|nr:hypothetical protein EDC01DRAFT_791295 [Geopyxis carbonaria]
MPAAPWPPSIHLRRTSPLRLSNTDNQTTTMPTTNTNSDPSTTNNSADPNVPSPSLSDTSTDPAADPSNVSTIADVFHLRQVALLQATIARYHEHLLNAWDLATEGQEEAPSNYTVPTIDTWTLGKLGQMLTNFKAFCEVRAAEHNGGSEFWNTEREMAMFALDAVNAQRASWAQSISLLRLEDAVDGMVRLARGVWVDGVRIEDTTEEMEAEMEAHMARDLDAEEAEEGSEEGSEDDEEEESEDDEEDQLAAYLANAVKKEEE